MNDVIVMASALRATGRAQLDSCPPFSAGTGVHAVAHGSALCLVLSFSSMKRGRRAVNEERSANKATKQRFLASGLSVCSWTRISSAAPAQASAFLSCAWAVLFFSQLRWVETSQTGPSSARYPALGESVVARVSVHRTGTRTHRSLQQRRGRMRWTEASSW